MTSLPNEYPAPAPRIASRLLTRLAAVLLSFMMALTPLLLRILPLAGAAIVNNAHAIVVNPGDCYVLSGNPPVLTPCPSNPTCSVTGGNFAVNAGAMAAPRDRINGSVLKTVSQSTSYVVTCTGADRDRTVNLVFALQSGQTGDTYPTGYAGLGIRYKITGTACTPSTESSISNGKLTVQCTVPRGQAKTWSFSTSADLIKTGAIAPGNLNTKPAVTVSHYFDGQAESAGKPLTNLYSTVLSGSIAPQSCSVTMPAVVALGDIPITMFKGIGSVSTPAKPFQISVDCNGIDSKVYMTLSDPIDPSNRSNTLTLKSKASGLGMQILRGSPAKPVSFGPDSSDVGTQNQFFVFDANAATPRSVVDFQLQYIQVSAKVTSGQADGVVTATMSYQ